MAKAPAKKPAKKAPAKKATPSAAEIRKAAFADVAHTIRMDKRLSRAPGDDIATWLESRD